MTAKLVDHVFNDVSCHLSTTVEEPRVELVVFELEGKSEAVSGTTPLLEKDELVMAQRPALPEFVRCPELLHFMASPPLKMRERDYDNGARYNRRWLMAILHSYEVTGPMECFRLDLIPTSGLVPKRFGNRPKRTPDIRFERM